MSRCKAPLVNKMSIRCSRSPAVYGISAQRVLLRALIFVGFVGSAFSSFFKASAWSLHKKFRCHQQRAILRYSAANRPLKYPAPCACAATCKRQYRSRRHQSLRQAVRRPDRRFSAKIVPCNGPIGQAVRMRGVRPARSDRSQAAEKNATASLTGGSELKKPSCPAINGHNWSSATSRGLRPKANANPLSKSARTPSRSIHTLISTRFPMVDFRYRAGGWRTQ